MVYVVMMITFNKSWISCKGISNLPTSVCKQFIELQQVFFCSTVKKFLLLFGMGVFISIVEYGKWWIASSERCMRRSRGCISFLEQDLKSTVAYCILNSPNSQIHSLSYFRQYADLAVKNKGVTVFINDGRIKPQLAYMISFFKEYIVFLMGTCGMFYQKMHLWLSLIRPSNRTDITVSFVSSILWRRSTYNN